MLRPREPSLRQSGSRSSAICCSPRSRRRARRGAVGSCLPGRSRSDPPGRRRDPLARSRRAARAATRDGDERGRAAREGVQRDGAAARRVTRSRAELPALGQPRAEDAADRDPGYAEGLADGAFGAEEARASSASNPAGSSASSATCSTSPGCTAASSRSGTSRSTSPRLRVKRCGGTRRLRKQFGVALAAAGDENWVEGDEDRLLQVASNLVENALR